jgi:hypothetical protein
MTPMKKILIGVALAALMASPASAEPQRNERLPVSAIHLERLKQHAYSRDLYLGPRESNQPPLDADPDQGPCSTAHDFCPGFFGDNG